MWDINYGLKRKKSSAVVSMILVLAILMTTCGGMNKNADISRPDVVDSGALSPDQSRSNIISAVEAADSSLIKTVPRVDTTFKAIALTFDGMGDRDTMEQILSLLDEHHAKATFFLPGMRVAEEPDIAVEIAGRGHSIGNYTLNRKSNLADLDTEEIYKEIALSDQIIQKETQIKPTLLRIKGANYTESVCKAAVVDGYNTAVGYSMNMQASNKSNAEIKQYFSLHISRGDIVTIDTEKKDALDLTAFALKEATAKGYHLLTVDDLLKQGYNQDGLIFPPPKNTGTTPGVFSYAYTTKKAVALTFEGMEDEAAVLRILNALDASHIKATFFLSALEVSDHVDLAKEIQSRGHEIESTALDKRDLTKLDYNKASAQIYIADNVFKEELGVSPKYLRPAFGLSNDTVCQAANTLGYTVATYSKYLEDSSMKSAQAMDNYIKKKITRGEIIALNMANPAVTKAIPLIANRVRKIGYDFATIDELYRSQYTRRPLKQIPGYNAAAMRLDNSGLQKELIHKLPESAGKTVALTFDDWAGDATVTAVLDILKANNIKASFFIRGKGAEANPNLLMAIAQDGHDIGNHSYSHIATGNQSIKEMQQDIIKCHQALTYAIQRQPEMFFRPPQFNIDEEKAAAIQACGYKNVIMSDLSPRDWDPQKTPQDVLDDIFTNVEDGSIITLHILDNSCVLKILQPTIDELRRQGYSFAKISDYVK
ncbi:polysaccharide deacetylase family protein [Oscillospiraceae bacterium PP1C4]